MRRFKIAIFVVTLLGHVPFAVGLAFALARLGVRFAPFAPGVAIATTALLVLALRGRLRRLRADRPLPPWRVRLIEEPYYAHWCAMALAWPLLLVTGPAAAIAGEGPGAAALGAYLTALGFCLYGVLIRRRWVRVRTLDIAIPGLGPAFDGYRIAQVSDLHIGGLWPRARAEAWVRRVNALDVDLVAMTGDYVTHGDAFHEDIAAVLSAMRGKDGALCVLGNHDYFGDVEALVAKLEARGVPLLRNASRVLARGGDVLTIAGVDDTWARRHDVAKALQGRRGPVVMLAHDPSLFPELARRGADLTLSGHTHWGQLAVPFLATRLNLSRLSYRYTAGLYREGEAQLYVNPGLGTTGPPIRLGAPPEITVIRLRAAHP